MLRSNLFGVHDSAGGPHNHRLIWKRVNTTSVTELLIRRGGGLSRSSLSDGER